jgi:hypothetical protein
MGLVLDIFGAILLFLYGLPEALSREGHQHLNIEQVDESEIQKAKRYDVRSRVGLVSLIVGFALQLIGNWV